MKNKKLKRYLIEGVACALLCAAALSLGVSHRLSAFDEDFDPSSPDYVVANEYREKTAPPPVIEPPEIDPEDPYAWDGEGADLELDFDELLSVNPDTVGWIDIPACEISYPVLYYPTDNDYYLRRSFEGTYDPAGVIYLEHTNTPDFSDLNSLIYGHNQADGTKFGRLHHLLSIEGVRDAAPYFCIYLPDGTVHRYYIFSCYRVDAGSLTYSTIDNEDGYRYYTQMAMDLNEGTQTAVDFEHMPPLVTLSTCHGGEGTSKRFAVHGVLVGIYTPEE